MVDDGEDDDEPVAGAVVLVTHRAWTALGVCLFVWLVVWLVGCLFGWLFVWLVGCLVGCLFVWLVGVVNSVLFYFILFYDMFVFVFILSY